MVKSPASHRDGRRARLTRREEGAYRPELHTAIDNVRLELRAEIRAVDERLRAVDDRLRAVEINVGKLQQQTLTINQRLLTIERHLLDPEPAPADAPE